jgi:hypothetical protein
MFLKSSYHQTFFAAYSPPPTRRGLQQRSESFYDFDAIVNTLSQTFWRFPLRGSLRAIDEGAEYEQGRRVCKAQIRVFEKKVARLTRFIRCNSPQPGQVISRANLRLPT